MKQNKRARRFSSLITSSLSFLYGKIKNSLLHILVVNPDIKIFIEPSKNLNDIIF